MSAQQVIKDVKQEAVEAASHVGEEVKETLLGFESTLPGITVEAEKKFTQHAKKGENGVLYMDPESFLDAIAPQAEDYKKIDRQQFGLLWKIVDPEDKGKINLQQWANFQSIINAPDAEYRVAFMLFDVNHDGTVSFEEFKKTFEEGRSKDALPFNFSSNWMKLYTGDEKSTAITYAEFTQMVKDIQSERARQAFHFFDKSNTGLITPEEFGRIITEIYAHKLSDHVLNNIQSLAEATPNGKLSFATLKAFQNLIREMDMVEQIVKKAGKKSPDNKITRGDFLLEASRVTRFTLFTPMEADILFHFAGMGSNTERLGFKDFAKVLDPTWARKTESLESTSFIKQYLNKAGEGLYNFALGSIAGAFGATVVYPIDLVKTRMQNQRKAVGEPMYKNSIDCFKKVIRNEGFTGLYSGLGPQLVGVAPEKAIKLTVNELVRGFATKPDGSISLPWEIFAGGAAGGCQVVFTNPLEIVKIRLQVQGEVSSALPGGGGAATGEIAQKRSAMWIIRHLGLRGLYKGASACLLRDVPFSAIYFPTYAHLKKDYFGESPEKQIGILQLLAAGSLAGAPAAYFTTPADVIKTRLQVEARAGQVQYKGLIHCARTIWRDEGFAAFFKGGPARIFRSSPQFGVTLCTFEVLKSLLPYPGNKVDDDGPAYTGKEAPIGFIKSRNALRVLLDMDPRFGAIQMPVPFVNPLAKN